MHSLFLMEGEYVTVGTILTYLKWRGDLSFSEHPFNDVDNLILSELAYLDFSGIVPEKEENTTISLSDALTQYKMEQRKPVITMVPDLFIDLLQTSRRFSGVQLSKFVDKLDIDTQIQFSAFHIQMEDDTVYIVFRGTGDEIVGWREDFSMSYQVMPSQIMSVEYLMDTMIKGGKKYRIGGHSKGGNLAIYAGTYVEDTLQNQILQIYSNDGPGLCPDILDMKRYLKIRKKIIRIAPESSIVGRLFEADTPDFIVKSNASEVLAHNGFTWLVEGNQFVCSREYLENSNLLKSIIDDWLVSSNMEQKQQFTKDFFDALESGGASRLSELSSYGVNGIEDVLISLARSEVNTKAAIGNLAKAVAQRAQKIDWMKLLRKRSMIVSITILFAGLIIIANPLLTGKIIGMGIGLMGLYQLSKQVIATATSRDTIIVKKWKIYIKLFLIMLVVSLLNQLSLISRFTGLVISLSFFYLAFRETKLFFRKTRSVWLRMADAVTAVISFLFGIIPVTSYALDKSSYTMTAGTFVLIYGTILTVRHIRAEQNAQEN